MRVILTFAPLYFVYFLLDLERFEVVELWFMRLKFSVELVLATLLLFV